MAKQVNVHDAKTSFSKLLQRVESGEEITIARNGMPVADLIAHRSKHGSRRAGFGSMKDQIDMSRFDDADEEIAREFGLTD